MEMIPFTSSHHIFPRDPFVTMQVLQKNNTYNSSLGRLLNFFED